MIRLHTRYTPVDDIYVHMYVRSPLCKDLVLIQEEDGDMDVTVNASIHSTCGDNQ